MPNSQSARKTGVCSLHKALHKLFEMVKSSFFSCFQRGHTRLGFTFGNFCKHFSRTAQRERSQPLCCCSASSFFLAHKTPKTTASSGCWSAPITASTEVLRFEKLDPTHKCSAQRKTGFSKLRKTSLRTKVSVPQVSMCAAAARWAGRQDRRRIACGSLC